MSVRFALAADATAVATHHPNPEIAALAARIVRAQSSEDLPSFEELAELLVCLGHYLCQWISLTGCLSLYLLHRSSLSLSQVLPLSKCVTLSLDFTHRLPLTVPLTGFTSCKGC